MLVLYASETGTAEDVAYKLHSQLLAGAPQAQIRNMECYDVTLLPSETCIMFVVSTTGDGEVPTSMKSFWQFLLRRSLASNSLEKLRVAVFGLGDSSYEKFNAAARKLNTRLKQLGATELVSLGLGDDQAQYGFMTELNPWTVRLSQALAGSSSSSSSHSTITSASSLVSSVPSTLAPPYDVRVVQPNVWMSSTRAQHMFSPPALCKLAAGAPPLVARVTANTRMTVASWKQDVRHIKLDLSPSLVQAECLSWPLFVAGDVATVHPCNPLDLVTRATRIVLASNSMLIADGDTSLEIINRAAVQEGETLAAGRKNQMGSKQCNLRNLLARYLDIGGMPRRSFFDGLSAFASDNDEREKLLELASPQGTDLYYDYCIKEKRNYVEVLEEFKSARPELPHLLGLIPPLQARHYSIASSGHVNPTELDLCAAVVDHTTPYGRKRLGICSSYLASLEVGDEVVLWVREGAFRAPSLETPTILVGPGTGVAPMRAVLQERSARGAITPSILFFGCRKRECDFLFGNEWASLESGSDQKNKGVVQQLLLSGAVAATAADGDRDAYSNASVAVTTAFSQDGPVNEARTYVMSKIRQHGGIIWQLVRSGGAILVAGSAKRMPADVRKAILKVIQEHGGVDEAESGRILQRMDAQKLYVVEAWA